MRIRRLYVTDFRSWELADINLEPGVNVFLGSNGQGKTNLVEAIGYIATLRSHRVASDAPLVRQGASTALIRAAVVNQERELLLELEITPGKANRARINRAQPSRARDLIGIVRTVLFAPEDLALVKGDPAQRRTFLDELLTTRFPRYAGVRADYERVIKQRVALLKSMRGTGSNSASDTLEVWDSRLAKYGAELLAGRIALIDDLRPYVKTAYAHMASPAAAIEAPSRAANSNKANIDYRSSLGEHFPNAPEQRVDTAVLEAAILAELTRLRRPEIERGVCLVGPHRDDLDLEVAGLSAKIYASHGEAWSFALALRLASYELLRSEGIEPILLLDDVFAELDDSRRKQLARVAERAEQAIITAAVAADVPQFDGALFSVQGGMVTRV